MVIDRQQIRYITLRKQIGTQAQVADLLAVTARTVQRRERGAMPITREAWLAIEMLSASPLYAPIRHPVNASEDKRHLSSHFPPVNDLMQKRHQEHTVGWLL